MKILLEDYKRKFESLKDLVPSTIPRNNSIDIDALINVEKLVTKIYDYKDFINDIERAIERENTLKAKIDKETALAWWEELLENKGYGFCESLIDDYLPTYDYNTGKQFKHNIDFLTEHEIEIIYHRYNG